MNDSPYVIVSMILCDILKHKNWNREKYYNNKSINLILDIFYERHRKICHMSYKLVYL